MPTGHHQRGCMRFPPRVRLREVVPTFVVVVIVVVVAMLIDHPLSSTSTSTSISVPFPYSFLLPLLPFSSC